MSQDKRLLEKYHEESVCELFHENSKQYRSDLQFIERIIASTVDPRMQMIMANAHKHYHGTAIIPLPQEYPRAKISFDRVILGRRSSRNFG